jgi:hypothetical protein
MTKEEELTAWKFRRHLRLKKKTAAFEAMQLCLRFYPWRVKQARARVAGQMIQDASPKGVRIATGFIEAMQGSS